MISIQSCKRDSIRPDVYDGDGKISYRHYGVFSTSAGVCDIDFDSFSLSSEFNHTYTFSGLTPINEHLNEYDVFLQIPSETDGSTIGTARLRMTLSSEGTELWFYESLIKDLWHFRWKDDDPLGDGWVKNYTKQGFAIPAKESVRYNLEVHYIPPDVLPEGKEGHVWMRIGGGE